jgi:A/G-specific adenine glycosylase
MRAPPGMRWVPIATLQDEALPNVMRKAIAHGLGHQLSFVQPS